jgi:thiol-disulfide isomerase/thioredoxin
MSRPPMIIITVILLGFLWGCSKNDSKSSQQSSGESAAGGKVTELFNIEKRPPKVPNFSWKDSTGATTTFDRFRGSVTLINFWATWCGPCKKELPDLVALSNELAGKNVKILGVSVDRAPNVVDLVSTFVSEHGISYQNVISNDDMEDAFGNPRAIPTSYLVDAEGNIAQTIVGMRTKEFYKQAIISLLK